MSRVLVFGAFDLFHPGHEFFLRAAAEYGDELYVVVARDSNIMRFKARMPIDSEQKRLAAVRACTVVTHAQLGYPDWKDHLQILYDLSPDVICLGYDQHPSIPDGQWKVVQLTAAYQPDVYKSSLLRERL